MEHRKRRRRVLLGLAIGGVLLVVVGGGLIYKGRKDQAAKDQAAKESAALEARRKNLQQSLDSAKRKAAEVEAAMVDDPAEFARLRKELEEASKARATAMEGARKGGGKPKGGSGGKPCQCPPGDPLCSCDEAPALNPSAPDAARQGIIMEE